MIVSLKFSGLEILQPPLLSYIPMKKTSWDETGHAHHSLPVEIQPVFSMLCPSTLMLVWYFTRWIFMIYLPLPLWVTSLIFVSGAMVNIHKHVALLISCLLGKIHRGDTAMWPDTHILMGKYLWPDICHIDCINLLAPCNTWVWLFYFIAASIENHLMIFVFKWTTEKCYLSFLLCMSIEQSLAPVAWMPANSESKFLGCEGC